MLRSIEDQNISVNNLNLARNMDSGKWIITSDHDDSMTAFVEHSDGLDLASSFRGHWRTKKPAKFRSASTSSRFRSLIVAWSQLGSVEDTCMQEPEHELRFG